MFKFSRRTKIILAFIVVIALGYAVVVILRNANKNVPVAFTNARMQGAIIAQNIVNISNNSTVDLEKVNQYDNQGDYASALALTTTLVQQSAQIRDQAVQLSSQVEEMTKNLSSVSNFDAQQAALESISSRLALITELVSYSGDLAHLLDLLQGRFNGASTTNAIIQASVNQINTDVNAINNFNAQAGQAMDRFDTIVK